MKQKKIKEINIKSNAKINLFLDVLSELPNGYHSIRTIFSEIDLCDDLNFVLTKKGVVRIFANKDTLANSNNLAYKVAVFIKDKYSVEMGVDISLFKRIPIAAGLGGGSSNAASTIIALNKLWDINMTPKEMHEIASNFGSDINFFLMGNTALGTGRGEQLESIDYIPIENILLVNPGLEISSNEAYQLVKKSKENTDWEKLINEKNIKYCFNKLEEKIEKKYAVISQIKDLIYENGGIKAMMSGSGSTVIGFFDNEEKINQAQKNIKRLGFWTYKTKTIQRYGECSQN